MACSNIWDCQTDRNRVTASSHHRAIRAAPPSGLVVGTAGSSFAPSTTSPGELGFSGFAFTKRSPDEIELNPIVMRAPEMR